MPILSLVLGTTELSTLIDMLTEHKDQQMAWVAAKHTTKAERDECMRKALICSIVIEQLSQT